MIVGIFSPQFPNITCQKVWSFIKKKILTHFRYPYYLGILGQNFVGKCFGKRIAISYEDAKTEFLTLFLKCFYKNDVIKYVIKVNLCIIDNHRYL